MPAIAGNAVLDKDRRKGRKRTGINKTSVGKTRARKMSRGKTAERPRRGNPGASKFNPYSGMTVSFYPREAQGSNDFAWEGLFLPAFD